MLSNGTDYAEMRMTPDSPPGYVPATSIINTRTRLSTSIGILPAWLSPWTKYVPHPRYKAFAEATKKLGGIAIARVRERFKNPPAIDRKDILARLMEARDGKSKPLELSEVQAESTSLMVAGSDTSSNTLSMAIFYIMKTPGVLKKLQAEVDAAIPAGTEVPTNAMVRDLKYLDHVMKETLRLHSLLGLGFPREVPVGPQGQGCTILGRHYPPGTVISVPAYTMITQKRFGAPTQMSLDLSDGKLLPPGKRLRLFRSVLGLGLA